MTTDSQLQTVSPQRRSWLKTAFMILVGGLAALGALVLAAVLWFFASCANNPDCLQFG
jgi:hypothetical protein